jgi:hypothetical protein
MSTPHYIAPETICIGKADDGRAVWQNEGGKPFISVHDAQEKQHLITVTDFEPIAKPYTRGSIKP